MPTMTILVGPPGSGKSTYAEKCIQQGHVSVSQDDQGKGGHMTLLTNTLRIGQNVVVDRMNFSREQREKYLTLARERGYETGIIVFQVPYDICLKRCLARSGHPTISGEQDARSALHTFFTKYDRPTPEEANRITFLGHGDAFRPETVLVDLDGTLCNIDHRLSHVRGTQKDWTAFFRGIPDDGVNEWCRELTNMFCENRLVTLCSGRPDDHKAETVKWLQKNEIQYNGGLYMRRRGDFRRDDVVKEIILDFEILPRYQVLFAVDDRKQVVDMWRKRGITCLQCAEGEF